MSETIRNTWNMSETLWNNYNMIETLVWNIWNMFETLVRNTWQHLQHVWNTWNKFVIIILNTWKMFKTLVWEICLRHLFETLETCSKGVWNTYFLLDLYWNLKNYLCCSFWKGRDSIISQQHCWVQTTWSSHEFSLNIGLDVLMF